MILSPGLPDVDLDRGLRLAHLAGVVPLGSSAVPVPANLSFGDSSGWSASGTKLVLTGLRIVRTRPRECKREFAGRFPFVQARFATRDAPRARDCRILTRMAYPRNLIQEGETVALDLRPHWWYFSRNILTGIPLAIILVLVFANVDNEGAGSVLWWVVALVFLAWAAWLVLKYFQWVMTYFVVTSRRVIYRTGVVSKKGVEIPLERINNINFHQRIIDRIIGAGDLDIESAGKDGQSHFDFVRHPDGVQHEIYRQMETRNMGPQYASQMPAPAPMPAAAPAPAPAPAPAAAPAASVPEQIEQLARLRDQGHITEAEYEQKKSELLGRM